MEEDAARLDGPGAKRFVGRSAGGLIALMLGAPAFGMLVALVQTRSPMLLTVDRHVTAWLNDAVSANPRLARLLQLITDLGSLAASAVILSTLTVVLVVRRMPRLAVYVAVTGLGAGVLSPAVKQIVGRLRPVVESPVATASGPGFPSGHARRGAPDAEHLRWVGPGGGACSRTGARRPRADPAPPMAPHPWHRAAELLVVWVLLLGTLLAAGWLITDALSGTGAPAFDTAVVPWLAEHRTPALTTLSVVGNRVGGKVVVSTLTLASIVLALAATRQWRPPLFLAVTMAGEVTLFLATTRIVASASTERCPCSCSPGRDRDDGGCSWSPRSPPLRSSRSRGCTAACATRPTSSAARCSRCPGCWRPGGCCDQADDPAGTGRRRPQRRRGSRPPPEC